MLFSFCVLSISNILFNIIHISRELRSWPHLLQTMKSSTVSSFSSSESTLDLPNGSMNTFLAMQLKVDFRILYYCFASLNVSFLLNTFHTTSAETFSVVLTSSTACPFFVCSGHIFEDL